MCAVRGPDDSGTGNTGAGHRLPGAGAAHTSLLAACSVFWTERPSKRLQRDRRLCDHALVLSEPGSTLRQPGTGISDSSKPQVHDNVGDSQARRMLAAEHDRRQETSRGRGRDYSDTWMWNQGRQSCPEWRLLHLDVVLTALLQLRFPCRRRLIHLTLGASSVGNTYILLGNPGLKYLENYICILLPNYRFVVHLHWVTKFYLKKIP